MEMLNKTWLAHAAVAGTAVAAVTYQAQPVATPDLGSAFRNSMVTKVITLTAPAQRGEPKPFTGTVQFDRTVDAFWVSVVGSDIKFSRGTEKQINRQFFSVDPFGKVINGKEIEISGKLGLRDGSGNWDDTYEGTITVAVTAVLADK